MEVLAKTALYQTPRCKSAFLYLRRLKKELSIIFLCYYIVSTLFQIQIQQIRKVPLSVILFWCMVFYCGIFVASTSFFLVRIPALHTPIFPEFTVKVLSFITCMNCFTVYKYYLFTKKNSFKNTSFLHMLFKRLFMLYSGSDKLAIFR